MVVIGVVLMAAAIGFSIDVFVQNTTDVDIDVVGGGAVSSTSMAGSMILQTSVASVLGSRGLAFSSAVSPIGINGAPACGRWTILPA